MFNFFRKLVDRSDSKENLAELEKLAERLDVLANEVELNTWTKDKIKANLFNNISDNQLELPVSLKEIGDDLKSAGQNNYLTAGQKHLIYCRVNQGILDAPIRNWQAIFKMFKTALASVLIFLISLTFFVIAPFDLRITRASKWTFLENVRGQVYVNRDGRIFPVNKDFAIEEGDLVFTRQNSFVEIRFLDDSIARLGENTSLEIKKLYAPPENQLKTEVEVWLVGGQIWASVYNLIDEQSKFVVETENALARVSSKAAFEMTALNKSTFLAVFDNVVDFSKKSNRLSQIQPVVSGFKAEVDSSNVYQLTYSDHAVVVERNLNGIDEWAKLNLDLDKKHLLALKKENDDFISKAVASDSLLVGALADFKDNTKLIFNSAALEKARVKFNDAQAGFMRAQQILNAADFDMAKRREALPLIYAYKNAVKEIMADWSNLKKENSNQAEQLFAHMKETVGLQKKALVSVMPDESLYTAKFVLNEVALNFAINDSEKAQFLLAEARDRLMEVEILIDRNDLKRAEASFRSYLGDIDDLMSQLKSFKLEEVEPKLFALINEQIKQFKVLNAIEKSLLDRNDQVLLSLVKRVNSSSLQKLLAIFQTYRKNGIPFEMLAELNNTIGSYFQDGEEKQLAVSKMEDLMKVYPEYKQLARKDIPELNELVDQSVVVVDFNATKDITVDDQLKPAAENQLEQSQQ